MSRRSVSQKKITQNVGEKQSEPLPRSVAETSPEDSQTTQTSNGWMDAVRNWLATSRFSRLADASFQTWQRRALRYLALFTLLVLVLVGMRMATYSVRPQLRDLQKLEADLLAQKDQLEIEVQVATTPQRIARWAESNGMTPFAVMPKQAQPKLSTHSAQPPVLPQPAVKLSTDWQP